MKDYNKNYPLRHGTCLVSFACWKLSIIAPNHSFFPALPPNKPIIPSATSLTIRIDVCMPWTVRCPSSYSYQPIVPIRQCCRIARHTLLLKFFCQCSCTLPLPIHASIHASSVFVKSWTIHLSELSSAPATNFFDAANLISTANFDIILLCHSNTIFTRIPLKNLTPLQTSPTRRSQRACRTKPEAPLH